MLKSSGSTFAEESRIGKLCWTLGAIAILLFARAASADTPASAARATKEEAVTLVEKAADYFKSHGADKAFAAFDDPGGPFIDRDLYIFVYDSKGTCLAHGRYKKLIGESRIDEQDANGIYYMRERIKLMETQKNFWTHYRFPDPLTHKIMSKTSYCEVVMDAVLKNIMICSGVYDAL
jgi:cytochrome c